jgi:hypothetical protein
VGNFFDGAEYPIILGFHFVRDSKRKFDFTNCEHIICDLLTAHDYIKDDNCDCLVPQVMKLDGQWYSIDKINPGVWLEILEDK